MTIKTFTFNPFQENTFVVYDDSKEAIVVDAGCSNQQEEGMLVDFIQSKGLTLKYLVNTHCHIDHVIGLAFLKNTYNVPFLAHSDDGFLLDAAVDQATMFGLGGINPPPAISENINEPGEIKVGQESLHILHVPGHSPGSIALYSPKDGFVIVGDVLFSGSIGRTDLPGGNYETIISSIKEKLMVLPGDTQVYSGHGPVTSIQHEHDTNPFLN